MLYIKSLVEIDLKFSKYNCTNIEYKIILLFIDVDLKMCLSCFLRIEPYSFIIEVVYYAQYRFTNISL